MFWVVLGGGGGGGWGALKSVGKGLLNICGFQGGWLVGDGRGVVLPTSSHIEDAVGSEAPQI